MAVCTAPTEDTNAGEEETVLEGHEKKADELAACAAPTEDTKGEEELPIMSELAKVSVEDDDSESTLSRQGKMENTRRPAVLSQVQQAVKVKCKLGKIQGPTGEG